MARGSVNVNGKNYSLDIMGMVGQTTIFESDGKTITQTQPNGNTLVIVFNDDGTITETLTQNGFITTKLTTFVSESEITEVIL